MRREPDHNPTDPAEQRPGVPIPDEASKADRDHLRELQRQRQGRVVRVILALVILAILIVFIVRNSQKVPVDFVFTNGMFRMIWVMFTCAVLGGIIGYLIGRPGKQIRLHRRPKDEERT